MGVSDANSPAPRPRSAPSVGRGRVRARIQVLGVVFVGGTLGTTLRASFEEAAPPVPGALPWTTLTINVCGAFALGLLLEILVRTGEDSGWRRTARLGLGTGVLGGFTTYSTFALEVATRLSPGAALVGLGYAASSVVLGAAAAALGIRLGHRVGRRQGISRSLR